MRTAKWWGKVACWFGGHNLIGVELPQGWTTQTCRTCGVPVQAFGRGGSQCYREIPEPREETR